MPTSQSRDEMFRARLEPFSRHLAGVAKRDPRAVHRIRVASRRLRELLPVLQLDDRDCRRLMRDLQEVTRVLGTLREADVLVQLADDLRGRRPSVAGGLTRLRDHLRIRRATTLDEATLAKLERRLARIARRLTKVAGEQRPDTDRRRRRWLWAVEARITRRGAALARAIEAAGSLYLPEPLHEVRKGVKKLRYAVELYAESEPGRYRADLIRLRRWQDLLGTLHDRQVLIERSRGLEADLAVSVGHRHTRELDAAIVALEDECRALHGRYLKGRHQLLAVCERVGTAATSEDASPAPARRVKRVGVRR